MDAPGAAGDQLGAGDEVAGLEGLFDGALSGWLVVLRASHSGGRASSSSISTAWDLRELSS